MAKNIKYKRRRVLLADQEKTIKWLAEQLGKKPNTVSLWCRNEIQPLLEIFYKVAEILKVEIYDLLSPLEKIKTELLLNFSEFKTYLTYLWDKDFLTVYLLNRRRKNSHLSSKLLIIAKPFYFNQYLVQW